METQKGLFELKTKVKKSTERIGNLGLAFQRKHYLCFVQGK